MNGVAIIRISHITVIQGYGPDKIILTTNLPSGMWPYDGFAIAHIDVAAGDGPKWVRENLAVEAEVIGREGGTDVSIHK